MKKNHFFIFLAIVCSLVIVYFVPVWRIFLEAPQYPEGLGMKIWIHKLSGDVKTINGLNHYIGMQQIHEDSIPELKVMPYFLAGLIVTGLIAVFSRKKWAFILWFTTFAVLGGIAGYDFWLWEYDYGHNLDPTAAIIVPGMSYQPPLLGSKQLLNFTAHSYPDTGGIIILLSAAVSFILLIMMMKPSKKAKNSNN